MSDKPRSITCPVCGMTSYSREDVAEGYCGQCHDFTALAQNLYTWALSLPEGFEEPR